MLYFALLFSVICLYFSFNYFSICITFIENVLYGLSFLASMISWIMECITTTTYSISLNDTFHGFFIGKRGLRQGSPLSPYLFVLAMEYFSRFIKVNTENPNFNFHPKCGKLGLSHLAFADDIMLFSRGDLESVRVLFQTLQQFKQVLGLEINVNKSRFVYAGVAENETAVLHQITDFLPGQFPVRYLGIPLVHGNYWQT